MPLDRGDAAQRGERFRRHFVSAAEILNDATVADEGLPSMLAIDARELRQILDDAPQLHAEARHQAVGLFDHREAAERRHFIEQEQNGLVGRAFDIARIDRDRLLYQQAQPKIESFQPIGRQIR